MNIGDQQQLNKAYDYAMFLLNIRLRTEGELRGKMGEKGYKGEVVDAVMGRLRDSHYVNDQRYAEVYLENLKKYKSWGYFGIKKKLMEKKLPMTIIESVLSENLSEEEELEIGKRFCSSLSRTQANLASRPGSKTKFASLKNISLLEKQKAARKLAAKGFRGSVVSKLLF